MMHNPMHPGDFIKQAYVDDLGLSIRKIAKGLNVAPSTLARLVKGESNVTPEMAMRLSKALHGSPELWLNMQKNFDLWQLRKMDLRSVTKIETKAA
jgi:addiction module HigA family antidote